MSLLKFKTTPAPAVTLNMLTTPIANVPSAGKSALFRGVAPSLWNLWKHGVSSSFLDRFETCREQTRLIYIEGWTPLGQSEALEFGQCCHWVLNQMYEMVGIETMKKLKGYGARDWSKYIVECYQQIWTKQNPGARAAIVEQQELIYGLAEAVLPGYIQRWNGDFTGEYTHENQTAAPVKWLSLEQEFKVPYIYPDGKRTWIRGRRDGVFRDKYGNIWVLDTKCKGQINEQTLLETLPFNTQQLLYLDCTIEEGIKPAGTIMNIIRRPGHRRRKDESLQDFLARVAGEVRDPRNFQHNFKRLQMAISPGEVKDWRRTTLDPLMLEVRGWWEGTFPHRMREQGLLYNHQPCPVYQIIVRNDYSLHYQRKNPFNELSEI